MDRSQLERVHDSLFDCLPDEIYLKIMKTYDLSVQDIEHVGQSRLDGRNMFAFDKLEHAIILVDLITNRFVSRIITKLPKTLKSVKLTTYEMEFSMAGIRSIAKRCPNLEYFPLVYSETYLEYIKSIGTQSKVK